MSVYTPDVWVVMKLYNAANNETLYKVLAGWFGGLSVVIRGK